MASIKENEAEWRVRGYAVYTKWSGKATQGKTLYNRDADRGRASEEEEMGVGQWFRHGILAVLHISA